MSTETNPYRLLNLGDALTAMRIVDDIAIKKSKMLGSVNSVLSLSIDLAIQEKRPCVEIVKMLQDCSIDNKNMVADIIGLKLTNEILDFGKSS